MKFLLLIASAAILFSCSKDRVNPVKCAKEIQDISKAAGDFSDNPTEATCNAYASALVNYVNACSRESSFDESYEAIFDSLDCSDYN